LKRRRRPKLPKPLIGTNKNPTAWGAIFLRVLAAAEEQLTRNPQAFPPTRGRFRRILLRRFPYALHFELLSDQRVSVLACLHHRRNPARWPGN
jgi:plasmid stabilization system protein ParE